MSAEVVYVAGNRRTGALPDRQWIWRVRCYYADDVKAPKEPRGLAIETVHGSDASKDMEVRAAQSRKDIGLVAVEFIGRAS